MPPAKIYDIGDHVGTAKELSEIYLVTPSTMKGRLYRWAKGEVPLSKVKIYGNDIPGRSGSREWRALSNSLVGREENLKKIKVGKFDNIPARFDNDVRRFPLPDMSGVENSGG